MRETLPNGIEINRALLAHGDMKRSVVLQARLRKAAEADNPELLAELMDEADRLMEKVIVAVPDELYAPGTPAGVKYPKPGFLDHLRQDAYDVIAQAARGGAAPGTTEAGN